MKVHISTLILAVGLTLFSCSLVHEYQEVQHTERVKELTVKYDNVVGPMTNSGLASIRLDIHKKEYMAWNTNMVVIPAEVLNSFMNQQKSLQIIPMPRKNSLVIE